MVRNLTVPSSRIYVIASVAKQSRSTCTSFPRKRESSRSKKMPGALSDSHCHLHMLDLAEFSGSLDKVLEAARDNQVKYMLCVGTTPEDRSEILAIADRYEGVSASVGLHPNEIAAKEPSVDELLQLADHPKIVAIGETGLDYYRTEEKQPWQLKRF